MSSPYSSNLLQQSSHDAPSTPRPQVGGPAEPQYTRSITHVVAQPHGHVPGMLPAPQPQNYMQPQYAPVPYAPQPMYAAPRNSGTAGNVASSFVLGLIVILVGVVALVGGYFAMRSFAPSAAEAAATTNLAGQSGYLQGRNDGLLQGRQAGASAVSSTAQLKAAIARQRAYDTSYQRGIDAGSRAYRRPAYYGSGYRYSGPRYSYPRQSSVTQALGSAQAIANATGSPVDVQVFGGN